MDENVRYWHFSKMDARLDFGDGRLIVAGETLEVPLPIELCVKGLHASSKIIDALRYAQGLLLWEVKLSGDIKIGYDKLVAQKRLAVKSYNLLPHIGKFAKFCADNAVCYANTAYAAGTAVAFSNNAPCYAADTAVAYAANAAAYANAAADAADATAVAYAADAADAANAAADAADATAATYAAAYATYAADAANAAAAYAYAAYACKNEKEKQEKYLLDLIESLK